MQCPNCQTENLSRAKFCSECGTKLVPDGTTSPKAFGVRGVDVDLPAQTQSEASSIAPTVQPTHALETERRFVTVLFADMVGYTTLSEAMDPEEVQRLMNRIFSEFERVIKDKNGYVDRFIGDALMAVFGIPQAAEDDPKRAVQTALLMREELKKLSLTIQQNLSLRIGINTGEILWGVVGGKDSTVWGDTVNVAQRLQSIASINSIIISQATQRHLKGGFRINQLPSLKLKGKEQFVQAYEVVGIEEIKLPTATPFIGRKEEMEQLKTTLQNTINGKNLSLLLVTGEAGVGKSRLLSEFDNFIKNNAAYEFRVFTEQCLPHSQLPYDPLAQIVRHYFDLSNLSLADAQKRLVREVSRLIPDNPLAHHFLGFFLGMKYPDSPLSELTPEAARTSAFNVLKKVLEYATRKLNIIIIIEDIQWSDVGTRDFLDYLSETAFRPDDNPDASGGLMIISTARQQENITNYLNHIKDLAQQYKTKWQTIELSPFPQKLTIQFINAFFKDAPLAQNLMEELWIKTGGNPLFLEELLRSWATETQFILGEKGNSLTLPENIWQITESWIDRLPEMEKKIIKVSSVFGRIFWESGLQLCLQQPPREFLLQLEAKGFIKRNTESLYQNDNEYLFCHELVRDVAYRMLLKQERVNFHHIVLKFLQAKQDKNELSEELYLKLGAYHAEESGDFKTAIKLYEGYGDYENNRYMLDESLWVYKKVQELIDKSELKDRAQIKAQVIEKEARIYCNLSRYQEAIERYERLRNEAPHWSWRIRGLVGLSDVFEKQSDYEAAFRYAAEATEIATHGKNNRLLAQALGLVALSFIGKGLYSGAAKLAQQLRTSFSQAMTETSLSPGELVEIKKELATNLNNIGLVHWYQGEYESALAEYKNALAIMQEINNRYGEASSYINIGNIYRDQGNHLTALAYYQKSLRCSQQIGARRTYAVALLNIGAIYHDQGDYQRAEEQLLKSLAISREINARREETVALTSLGNLYHDQGNYSQALKLHLENLPLKRKLAEKSELVITLLNIATLFFEQDEHGEIPKLINEAEKIVNEVKAKMEIISSLNSLGRMLVYFALMGGLPDISRPALYEKAREHLQNALKMARSLNLRKQTLEALISLALVNIQEISSTEGSIQTLARSSKDQNILFGESYKLLKEAENILPHIHHKESYIHYYFAWSRYYLELINYLNKKTREEADVPKIKQATEEALKITNQALNLTQELGLKRLRPEALYLHVRALSLAGEKTKADNYYENCRQLAEMMGFKSFLRITSRMPV